MLMHRYILRALGLCVIAATAVNLAGCDAPKPAANTQKVEHDHDHEEGLAIANFGESVGTLRKLHDQIKTAFEAGKPDDAHGALHSIGHVLEALEKQVNTVAADKQESAKAAVKVLFDGYMKIDKAMHDAEEIKYADLSEDLSKNVAALEAAK
jgi:hypothetical protein